VARADAALRGVVPLLELDDPVLAWVLRYASPSERAFLAQKMLGRWKIRRIGQDDDPDPWPLGGGAVPNSDAYDNEEHHGGLWREREEALLDLDPIAYARRLIAPITMAVNVDFLLRWSDASSLAIASTAREILAEIRPSLEASLADSIRAADTWRDTFLLWLLVRHQNALELLHPLVLALATRYGTLATQMAGIVYATTPPFQREPLVSATAALGKALWKLDYRPTLLPGIVAFVRQSQNPDGGFGDPGQPSDVLTTLVAADLLSTLDPGWDPTRTAEWFCRMQEPGGWWRALDPEVPWLTGSIADWLRSSELPFPARFEWPEYQKLDRDRKTGVPGYSAFDRLVRVFRELGAVGSQRVQVAFLDLAHFRDFNGRFGQRRGDEVLRAFAQALAAVPDVLVIRDGGDEFLVVCPPTDDRLADRLRSFMSSWPSILRGEFGPDTPPVAPRVIVSTDALGSQLEQKRELLGTLITPVKEAHRDLGPEGILVTEDEAREIEARQHAMEG
jgi:GGDEF domain-containing protein